MRFYKIIAVYYSFEIVGNYTIQYYKRNKSLKIYFKLI